MREVLLFGIFTFYIAGTRNIVYRDIIKSCKDQKTVEGNTGFSAFIIGICALANMKQVCNVLLSQGTIFPDFADAFIVAHKIHHLIQNSIRIFDSYLTNRVINSKIIERRC